MMRADSGAGNGQRARRIDDAPETGLFSTRRDFFNKERK